ncbi:hypothetical protein IW261DRAFT_1628449 [Armillaria novae-zelandiae]|uniref:Uncharacterized protein n=1 Tax=Armillaria novae-zelandiae TaxID=153914 RepID=A0AA39P7A5_9AGAR|nr:hypothetical protein IW261DRAFT_1628449 [Armillaria novae-zelandiae]
MSYLERTFNTAIAIGSGQASPLLGTLLNVRGPNSPTYISEAENPSSHASQLRSIELWGWGEFLKGQDEILYRRIVVGSSTWAADDPHAACTFSDLEDVCLRRKLSSKTTILIWYITPILSTTYTMTASCCLVRTPGAGFRKEKASTHACTTRC